MVSDKKSTVLPQQRIDQMVKANNYEFDVWPEYLENN
jgi:hypothetical protein